MPELRYVIRGVCQGSIHGPSILLIYINGIFLYKALGHAIVHELYSDTKVNRLKKVMNNVVKNILLDPKLYYYIILP